MPTSFSSLVDNLSEIHNKKCGDKNCESECDLIGHENNELHCKCNKCKKRQLKPINGLIKKFSNRYEFCNGDINKFILLLSKGVYPYEYMNSLERFDEISLPDKKAFYSELNHFDMLLMVEKGIRGRICHPIHRYAKANNKYMKNYDKNIILYLIYLDANNFYVWRMSQKFFVAYMIKKTVLLT